MGNLPLGPCPQDWDPVSLKDITTKIGSGATPRGGEQVYLTKRDEFALVRSQNVFDRYFEAETLAFISRKHANELSSVWLQPNDILLNITGDGITFGRACQIPQEVLPACVNQHVVIIRVDPQKADSGYILSYLTHPDIKRYIESFNAGGSRRAVTKGHIESFMLALPPLPEQRAIAHILGTLDDKIELNRQMNQTLEGMARALFQSWFVDFDPVHAKARGEQPPGLDPVIANLFPNRLVQTKMGLVPEGWSYLPIKSVVNAVYDGPHATPDEALEGPVYLGIKNLTGTGLDFTDIRHISERDFPRWIKRVQPQGGDIVFSYEAALGLFALIPFWLTCCLGRRIALIRPRNELNNTHFLFHTFIAHPFQRFLKSRVNPGSTVDRILLSKFPNYPILYPSDLLINAFEECVTPMWNYIHSNQVESQTLAELRDTLLPKLMSGELRVPEAAELVEGI